MEADISLQDRGLSFERVQDFLVPWNEASVIQEDGEKARAYYDAFMDSGEIESYDRFLQEIELDDEISLKIYGEREVLEFDLNYDEEVRSEIEEYVKNGGEKIESITGVGVVM